MPAQGSTVVRRQLGRRLRRLREEAGKTVADVQEAKLFSTSKVFRIETGRATVKAGDVWALCRFYGADRDLTDSLAGLTRAAHDGWWEEHRGPTPDWFWMYLELEAACDAISIYSPDLVHGLLQTDDYALAAVSRDGADDAVVQHRLQVRSQRKLAAFGHPGKRITLVLGQAALSLVIGSPQVMEEQFRHLRDLSDGRHFDFRVLPWSAGLHAAGGGAFTIMDFDDPDDPSVAYVEAHTAGRYVASQSDVAEYRQLMGLLVQESLPLLEFQR